jgi:peptide/nickel transport system substrate-binding protein
MPGRVLGRVLCGFACGLAVAASASAKPAVHSKYGGVLTVALANGSLVVTDPSGLGLFGGSTYGPYFSSICEGLLTTDKKLNFVPQLATSLPTVSPDKLTYTVQVRQGIMFNDGTPLNAQAVVTTYQHDIDLASQNGRVDPLLSFTVAATGPYTVAFHLRSRYSPFLFVLTSAIESPTQLQKLGGNFGADPICVGPFMYDSQIVGNSVTIVKSPYYYNKYAVHLDKIVFLDESSSAVATAALQAGDVQAVNNLNPGDLPSIQGDKSLSLIQAPVNGDTDLVVNLGHNASGNPLAQSPKLLQAFEEAIDRKALAKILAPVADPGCTFIPPLSPAYDPTLKCTPYNPADARKLVAASGISNPTIHMLTLGATRQGLIAQFVQSEEQAVGINVVIDTVDGATGGAYLGAGNYEVWCTSGYTFNSDPATGSGLLVYDQGSDNASGFSTPQLALILKNYVKSTSVQSHKTLLRVAQQIILNARPVIVLYHVNMFLGYSDCLSGIQAVNGAFYRIAFAQYTC